jgi:hypothetical protein
MMPPRKIQAGARLLGKALLGPGQGGGVGYGADFAAPPYYLLRDEFTTDRAAGAVDGTAAEPGPGVRSVVDGNSVSSISGGQAIFIAGGVSGNNPAWTWPPVGRVVGRIVIGQFTASANGLEIGFDSDATGGSSDGNRQNGTLLQVRTTAASILAVGAAVLGTEYKFGVILRNDGAFHFVKGGAFANWTLIWANLSNTYTMAYPHMSVTAAAAAAVADYIRVPAVKWLPVPLVSDGFSAWGESDGLGHAEGLAGGLGSGGGGLAWTATVGTWGASGGVAVASALSGGRAIATLDCGKADVIVSANCTRSAGSMAIIVRWVDENNFIRVSINATSCVLVKVVAGVSTTVSDVAYTYVAGAPLRVICSGSAFRRFYNNAAIGAEFTIADAALQSPTLVGLRTDNTGNTFDDFTVYARGTNGEYAELDMIASWYGAGGTIAAENLLEWVETPDADQAADWAGTVADGQPWTVAIRSTYTGADPQVLFSANSTDTIAMLSATGNDAGRSIFVAADYHLPALLVADDAVYFVVCDGTVIRAYRDNVLIGTIATHVGLIGTEFVWRGLYGAPGSYDWLNAVPGAAIYDVALSGPQRAALYREMAEL